MNLTEQQEKKIELLAAELNLSPETVLALILESGPEKFTPLQSSRESDFSSKLESLQRLASSSPNRFRTTQDVRDHIEALRQGC